MALGAGGIIFYAAICWVDRPIGLFVCVWHRDFLLGQSQSRIVYRNDTRLSWCDQ